MSLLARRAELVYTRERLLERYGDAATGRSDSVQWLLMISSRSDSAQPPVGRLGILTRAAPNAILNRNAIYIGPRTLCGMSAPSPGRAAT